MRNRQHTPIVHRPAPSPRARIAHHLRGLRDSLRTNDAPNARLHASRLERAMQTGNLGHQSTLIRLLDKAKAMALPGGDPMLFGAIE